MEESSWWILVMAVCVSLCTDRRLWHCVAVHLDMLTECLYDAAYCKVYRVLCCNLYWSIFSSITISTGRQEILYCLNTALVRPFCFCSVLWYLCVPCVQCQPRHKLKLLLLFWTGTFCLSVCSLCECRERKRERWVRGKMTLACLRHVWLCVWGGKWSPAGRQSCSFSLQTMMMIAMMMIARSLGHGIVPCQIIYPCLKDVDICLSVCILNRCVCLRLFHDTIWIQFLR